MNEPQATSEPSVQEAATLTTDPRKRTLKILAIAAAVASLAALVAQGLSQDRTGNAFEVRLAFPDLEAALDDVAKIEIQTKDLAFTVVKADEGDGSNDWGVAERGWYPVRSDELRALLWGLGDLELVEQKTARADRHKSVGLVAPEDGGDATRIRVLNADNVALAAALFGIPEGAETLDGRLRTWLRMDGDNQTWLGEGRLEIEPALEEWLDLDFLDVDANRIASVFTTPGTASQGSDAFAIARPDADTYNFALLDLYKGEEVSGPTVANGLGRALIAMTFSDALPANRIGFDNAAIVRYETFDGLALTLRVRRYEEDYWITLAAETFRAEEAPSDDAPSMDDMDAEALAINERASHWAFRIAEWKGQQLTIARSSMIKKSE
jgi:hypothetical protein